MQNPGSHRPFSRSVLIQIRILLGLDRLLLLPTMHLVQDILGALDAPLLLRLLGREQLEDDDEELGVRRAVLEDVSEGVGAELVRT